MRLSKSKTTALFIVLIMTFAVPLVTLPLANAHTPPVQLTTNAYIVALPDPIGVSQSTLIYMWLNRVFGYYPAGETSGIIAYAAVNNDYRFHNYKLTITPPNGTDIIVTFDTVRDTTSNQGYRFTPSEAGNYTLKFDFPGQDVNTYSHHPRSVMVNDTYLPSSATTTLTVQQDPIFTYPDSYPLPEEYWTRPIYGENPDWWSISSNWLGTGAPGYQGITSSYNLGGNGQIWYAGDTVGPLTGHIMWTHPLESGGIVGGNDFLIQGNQYFEGSAYNQRYQNPIIVNGKIYYNEPRSFTGSNLGPLVCQDLRTGKVIWSRADLPQMSFALIWDHEDPNQHGVFPAILATSNFGRLFDAETGDALFNVTGVPSGWTVMGPMGEQIRYVFQNLGNNTNPNYVIAKWNSTKLWNFGTNPYTNGSLLSPAIINATYQGSSAVQVLHSVPLSPLTGGTGTTSTGGFASIPVGSAVVVNGGVNNASNPQNRFEYSIPVSWRNKMPSSPTIVGAIYDDIMILQNGTLPSQGATFMGTLSFVPYSYFAVNLNASKGNIGDVLWTKTYDPPPNNITVLLAGFDPVNRVFVEDLRETQTFVGYSMDTGARLWTTDAQNDFDYYGSQASGSLTNTFAYGRLYSSAYAGIVYCYDTNTGKTLWTYGNGGPGNSTDSGFQAPGHYPTFINGIGNDVVYLITSEHTVETPVFKGALTRAINATTGAEIWTLSSYVTEFVTSSFAIADGYATWFNSYDDSIYIVGRGPSATTVQAPLAAVELGKSIVITGTVKDISAGATQPEQAARFPNGLPLSSDESMKDWMGYVYQQKPIPSSTFKGVDVTIDVFDANNNYRNIGTATTDASGAFSFHWKPDIEGKYIVVATFHGTNGYWPSYAEGAFAVDPAAVVTPPEKQPPAADYTLPIVGMGIAVILAVAIVGALILRKH